MEDSDTETCIFCKIVNADVNDIPEYDRPFIYNEYFFAIPALGQFIEGYILICPRKHIKNLGLLNSEESQYYNEIKQQIHDLLLEEYDRPPVFFEHGSASYNMRGGSCVDHAHLHAMPLELSTPPSFLSEELDGGRIYGNDKMVELAKAGIPYFSLECSNGATYLYQAPIIPCQFGRQMIACEIGLDDKWDWRVYPYRENAAQTYNRLKNRLSISKSPIQAYCHHTVG